MIEGSSRPVETTMNDKKTSSRSAAELPSVRNDSAPINRDATEDPLAEFYAQAQHDQEAEVCLLPDIRLDNQQMIGNSWSTNSGSYNLNKRTIQLRKEERNLFVAF